MSETVNAMNAMNESSGQDKRALLARLLREKASRPKYFPASFGQQRLWLVHQFEPSSSLYNMMATVRLRGDFDLSALRQAFTEITRRHESLRTTFAEINGEPMQVVHPAKAFDLQLVDLVALPAGVRDAEARRVVSESSLAPFDLSAGPLLRGMSVRLEESEHILLLTMHHIISDAWSMNVLVHEVGVLYHAFSNGLPSPLAELPIQYADFSRWQREHLSGAVLEEHLDYWRRHLDGELPLLELPTDRPRPAVRSLAGSTCGIVLPSALSEQLRALSRSERVTMFMLMLAAFKTLLYRYSGQPDIIVGTPVAGRERIETESLIGFFINMVVLRSDLSDNSSFREFLRRTKEVALGAYAHQEMPFDRLVDELHVNRSSSHSPIFQVVFDLRTVAQSSEPEKTTKSEGLGSDIRAAKFDLALNVTEIGECITGTIEYRTDLFDEATIKRMLAHYQNLLEAICADPDTRVQELPLLSAEESRHLLCDFNPQAPALPPAVCLHHLFETQAARSPEAPALSCDGIHLSYGKVNEHANRLAHHLRSLGVGPESRVGVLLDRTPDLVIAILGILKAGAAYLPLDPTYPQGRLSFMLADAGAQVIVTKQSLVELLEQSQAALVCLDDQVLVASASTNLSAAEVGVSAENAAYVIYTSGSTGQPKGVVVTHENVWRLLEVTRADFEFDERDVWTLFHSVCFDFSVWELWGPLAHGARLVVVPYWVSREPEAFYQLLKEEGVTVLNQTPSAFRQLMKVDEAGSGELALRVVIFGGEALEMSKLRGWFERHGDERPRLVNMYGITETTVHVTYRELKASDVEGGSVIGGALGDLEVYVLDQQMRPVPEGVSGELYVGGGGVARGYLGRAGLTAQRFVPHPYSERAGARLYRTGDLARRRADGELEYVGRLDEQVKIRGFRIELGEIEAVLCEQDGVQEAVVVTQGGPTDQRLVAYLLPDVERGAVLRRLLRDDAPQMWPEESRYQLPNGMTVMHLNRGETQFLYSEIFAEQSYLKHGIKLKAGACVFDVGANIGLFSLFVIGVCPQARLYCFEPLPPVFQVLKANAALYAPDAKLYECGLSSRSGQERFTYYPEATVMSGQYAAAAEERETIKRYILNQESEQLSAGQELEEGMIEELLDERLRTETHECRLRTLSEVIAEEEIEQIDLLKIDVEKSELEVLEGLDEGDWEKIKQIVVEVHGVDERLEAVQNMLQRRGYQVWMEQDGKFRGTTLYNVFASREWTEEERSEGLPEREQGEWRRWYSEAQMITEVQQHLREKLPSYMMPSAFALVSEWPLTSNGKLDKKALAAVKEGRHGDEKTYVAPRTPVEEIIAGIFIEVLSIERVGIFDNFFDLGGHSLLVTLVVSRLREAFHVELPLRAVFEHPAVADLSLAIAQSIMESENGTDVAELLIAAE